ncbi:MAG: RimK family alpha-L-glutamate ligase [Corallococcus sp.]|nr:RimK family alpha-L-glutamate ligase [Corallococcus sp.]MCM1359013.1 RimK family alpha-L-glutamate ligase [Corallococcus sp.]MCM1395002.1 RimK family alpha-L-glutamate ligase [Corallococcus sp.]
MTGWLVINGFLRSPKFDELYAYFQNAARVLGVELRQLSSAQLSCDISSDFSQFGTRPDFVLFWDKDAYLARRLERVGLKLFNSAVALETCDSKAQTALALCGVVPTPKTIISPKTFQNVGYSDLAFVDNAVRELGLPLVVKEEFGSFGQQVYLAKTFEEAMSVVKSLGCKGFVMQQFVETSFGRDIRINVVGDKVVCSMLRQSDGDFRSNVTLGGNATSYVPTETESRIAVEAVRAVGADFAGVDVLFGANGPLVCEVNSNPHFKSTLDCTGVDMSEKILQYVLQKVSRE